MNLLQSKRQQTNFICLLLIVRHMRVLGLYHMIIITLRGLELPFFVVDYFNDQRN